MTDQADWTGVVIENREQFEEAVAEVVDLKRDVAAIDLEVAERVQDAQADGVKRTKSMRERLAVVLPGIWQYVDEHPDLFKDAQELSLPGAVIARTASTRNTILDMKKLVKAVRDIGESSLVQVVESVTVTAIKGKEGVLEKLLKRAPSAIRSDRYWNFKLSFKPKDTKSEKGGLPKPESHDLLRSDPLVPDSSD